MLGLLGLLVLLGAAAWRAGPTASDMLAPETAASETSPSAVEAAVSAVETPASVAEASAPERPAPDPAAPAIASAEWHPTEPEDGSAVLVVVTLRPDAPEGTTAEAELDGRPIPLAPTETGEWFGIGPLAIGATGTKELTVRSRSGATVSDEQAWILTVRARTYGDRQLRVAPGYAEPPAALLERIAEERDLIRATLGLATAQWRADRGFGWPRPPRIRSGFGERRLYNGRLQSRHYGLDLAGDEGAPALASAAGRVALAGDFYYQGNAVYVDHGLGVYTGYFHLSRIDVVEDQEVTAGELIGAVGSTGRVTGPHLHWSAYAGGQSVDPTTLLDLRLPPREGPGEVVSRDPVAPPSSADAARPTKR